MTRKDFKLLAELVLELAAVHGSSGLSFYSDEQIQLLALRLAGKLATTNPLFSQARFLEACGIK